MEKALERDTGEMAAAAGAAADSECVAGGPGGGVEPESRLFSAHIQGRAKTLAVDDTVLFGRVMLVQGQARSEILQADAQLNAPRPAPAANLA